MATETPGLSWTVLTHTHEPHSTDWYWALGLFAVGGAALSAYFGDVLLGCILLIGTAALGFTVARGPREHAVRIDPRGVTVDGTLYPFATIMHFSIGQHHNSASLVLSVSSVLTPHIALPIEEVQPEMVRMAMRRYCEEKEFEPRLIDALAEIAGL